MSRPPAAASNRRRRGSNHRSAVSRPPPPGWRRRRRVSARPRPTPRRHRKTSSASRACWPRTRSHSSSKAQLKGIVSKKAVEPGQIVQPGQPLMTLIPLEEVWVTANFKETQLQDVHPGQQAVVEVDAYGGSERLALQPAAAGKRHRQLREGRAARACPHRD